MRRNINVLLTSTSNELNVGGYEYTFMPPDRVKIQEVPWYVLGLIQGSYVSNWLCESDIANEGFGVRT